MAKPALVIGAAFWMASVGSAGALAYTASHPYEALIDPPRVHAPSKVLIAEKPVAQINRAVRSELVTMPALEIKAHVAPPPAPAPKEVHCTDWKPLEQGSASVRICE